VNIRTAKTNFLTLAGALMHFPLTDCTLVQIGRVMITIEHKERKPRLKRVKDNTKTTVIM
jgi:hypothetical protein